MTEFKTAGETHNPRAQAGCLSQNPAMLPRVLLGHRVRHKKRATLVGMRRIFVGRNQEEDLAWRRGWMEWKVKAR
jgi:hypothetical protein